MNARPSAALPPPGQRLDAAALRASLAAALAAGPPCHRGVWVFAYGSLIWNPEFAFVDRVAARVHGYHRRLCLRSLQYRGTPECPGIVAGLDRGGSCAGVLYRLPAAGLHATLERLWEREMFMNSYAARWLAARRIDRRRRAAAQPVTALAFVVRRDAPNYAGRLPTAELLAVLGRARGRYGTSLEYLRCTIAALRAEGLADPHLEQLAAAAPGCAPADRGPAAAAYDAPQPAARYGAPVAPSVSPPAPPSALPSRRRCR